MGGPPSAGLFRPGQRGFTTRRGIDTLSRWPSREDGHCVIEDVLAGEDLARTHALAAERVGDISTEHLAKWRSEGSLIHLGDHPTRTSHTPRRRLRAFITSSASGDPS